MISDLKKEFKDFNELEKEFVKYKLSGAELSNSELEVKFGIALEALSNNLQLRRYIADQKIQRRYKKQLVEEMKLDKFIETIPLALQTLIDAMQDDNAANRIRAASQITKPVLSYLGRLAENSADSEFKFNEDSVNDFEFDYGK